MARHPGVEKRGPNSYRVEIWIDGKRTRISFNAASDRDAKAEADRLRRESRERHASTPKTALTMTIHRALDTYLADKYNAERDGYAHHAAELIVNDLKKRFPERDLLHEFRDAELAELIRLRERDTVIRLVGGKRVAQPITPATLNRTTAQFMRRVFGHIEKTYGLRFPDKPIFKNHLREEFGDKIREISDETYRDLTDTIRDDFHDLFDFLLMTGMREANATFLRRDQVTLMYDEAGNVTGGRALLKVKSRGPQKKEKPSLLSAEACAILLRQQHEDGTPFHPEFFFTYRVKRTRDGRVRGERLPMTISGLRSWWGRHKYKHGAAHVRLHDARHTAATRILEATGDITLVQKQLGHRSINTSMKYAHAKDARVLDAVNKVADNAVWGRRKEKAA